MQLSDGLTSSNPGRPCLQIQTSSLSTMVGTSLTKVVLVPINEVNIVASGCSGLCYGLQVSALKSWVGSSINDSGPHTDYWLGIHEGEIP